MSATPMTRERCYEPGGLSADPGAAREFEPEVFDHWVERLAERGAGGILMSLVLKLERLGRAPVSAKRRLEVMVRLMPAIRDLADELPKPSAPRRAAERPPVAAPLSLEQRLWCLTFRNLKQTLESADGHRGGELRDMEQVRLWLLDGLFECLGRTLELCIGQRHVPPPNTWQQMHDLYAYFLGRVRESQPVAAWQELDPDIAYKRLLLFGVIAGEDALAALGVATTRDPCLDAWARESDLHDPGSYFGVMGAYVVEASRDQPPILNPGALGAVARAWVLSLPDTLRVRLRAEQERNKAILGG